MMDPPDRIRVAAARAPWNATTRLSSTTERKVSSLVAASG